MTRSMWIAAVTLLVAACTPGAVETTTSTSGVVASSSTEAPTTTGTTAPTTTRTSEPEVVALGYSNSLTRLSLRTDRIYVHDRSLVPVTFRFPQPGWELLIVGDELVGILHSTEPSVAFHLSFFPGETIDGVVTYISERTEVERPMLDPVEFGGIGGGMFEMAHGFDPLSIATAGPCAAHTMVEDRVLDARVGTFLSPCSVNKIWMAEFDAGAVALHVSDTAGTRDQPADLDRMEPLIDEFLGAITFNP